jgi:hypothetical protein
VQWGLEELISIRHAVFVYWTTAVRLLLLEGGELIKQCTEYKYLGMKINREGTQASEINERINYAI